MIFIFNLSGLLLGLAGAAAGIVTIVLTGRLSFGVAILCFVWLAFGWRKIDPATGAKRPFPSLFFIPLPFLALPLLLLTVPMLFVERDRPDTPRDPRAALLDADERSLRSSLVSGDAALSKKLRDVLVEAAASEVKPEEFRVFTRTRGGDVLVLVQVPNLKQFADTARVELLDAVETIVDLERSGGGGTYVGVKGRVAFGAIRVPPDVTKTGTVVPESMLYPFYGDAASSTQPAPATAPIEVGRL